MTNKPALNGADVGRVDRGFPWGDNNPTIHQRIGVAILIAIAAATLHFFRAAEHSGNSDFAIVWNAARLLLQGQNPYLLIGPNKLVDLPSVPYYPAPAFVAVIPFTWLSVHWASTAFIFISSALLAYGCTRDSWHLLPVFPSISFLTAAQLGQWAILFAAALYFPMIAALSIAKPQNALPVIASARTSRAMMFSLAGGTILVLLSFALLPHWLRDWWQLLRESRDFSSPLFQYAGVLVVAVLIRWRRPEAWLVFVAACLPQTWYPYNGLLLLFVAQTYREACILSLVSTAAWVAAALLSDGPARSPQVRAMLEAALIFGGYLPAAIAVIRRPNVGPAPFFLKSFGGKANAEERAFIT